MDNFPNISIIIVTYNGKRYIPDLFESLCNQSYAIDKMEIIVLDNASTDDTADIISKQYPKVKVIKLGENIGYAAGNNKALQYASHDFLVFLNQDTICHRNWLRGLIQCMQERPDAGACTSNMVIVDSGVGRMIDRNIMPDSLSYYDLSIFGYACYRKGVKGDIILTKMISGCSFVIRRKLIEELRCLFDEDLWMYVEDTDLSLRIHNLGYKTCAVRDSVVYHLHNMNIIFNIPNLNIAAKAIMNRVYVFFKNMSWLEFIVFYPLLLFGGMFKIITIQISLFRKILYTLPYAVFSISCMVVALSNMQKYYAKRKIILKNRTSQKMHILRLILN